MSHPFIIGTLSQLQTPATLTTNSSELVSYLAQHLPPILLLLESAFNLPVILNSLLSLPADITTPIFLHALASPRSEIQSIGKDWAQNNFPSYSSERSIPLSQLDGYSRLILSLNRFCSSHCPLVSKASSIPFNVLTKAHELLSRCCLPKSVSSKVRWMLLAYPALLKQKPDLHYLYAFLQTLFTMVSLWDVSEWPVELFKSLWNGIESFYAAMRSDSASRSEYQRLISLSSSILCSMIRRNASQFPLSLSMVQSCVAMLREEELSGENARKGRNDESVALELFQFLNNASLLFSSQSPDVQNSILVVFIAWFDVGILPIHATEPKRIQTLSTEHGRVALPRLSAPQSYLPHSASLSSRHACCDEYGNDFERYSKRSHEVHSFNRSFGSESQRLHALFVHWNHFFQLSSSSYLFSK